MSKYEQFFIEIAKSLDLNDTEIETITRSYNAVGEFLAESSVLKPYSPKVFPQGSMRLGTVVKPLSRDDYDIDLVCELQNGTGLSPKQVKQFVGYVLQNSKYKSQLEEEHGRCWTLDYSANPPYHLDILPGIEITGGRVKATIKRNNIYDWLFTNPKGFANWFLSLYSRRRLQEDNKNVESVKIFDNKTPLQRAVQLIKRHRDVYYRENPDDGPASIIITTLSGLSYNDEASIESILRNGPIQWLSHISYKNGKYSIKVPSLPDDDYADKWNGEDKGAAKRFFEWHRRLLLDLDELFRQRNINDFLKVAKRLFADSTIDKLSKSNVRLIDSLRESFDKENHLPVKVDDIHPLFIHAQSIYKTYPYMYRSGVSISLSAKVFNNERDALNNSNDISALKFDDYSLLIPKERWIRFYAYVINPSHINTYVLFQVTNTGEEAKKEKENQMRGDFYPPENNMKYTRIEHTMFRGTHFVQAFLIERGSKADYCIAKSEILTVNIGE